MSSSVTPGQPRQQEQVDAGDAKKNAEESQAQSQAANAQSEVTPAATPKQEAQTPPAPAPKQEKDYEKIKNTVLEDGKKAARSAKKLLNSIETDLKDVKSGKSYFRFNVKESFQKGEISKALDEFKKGLTAVDLGIEEKLISKEQKELAKNTFDEIEKSLVDLSTALEKEESTLATSGNYEKEKWDAHLLKAAQSVENKLSGLGQALGITDAAEIKNLEDATKQKLKEFKDNIEYKAVPDEIRGLERSLGNKQVTNLSVAKAAEIAELQKYKAKLELTEIDQLKKDLREKKAVLYSDIFYPSREPYPEAEQQLKEEGGLAKIAGADDDGQIFRLLELFQKAVKDKKNTFESRKFPGVKFFVADDGSVTLTKAGKDCDNYRGILDMLQFLGATQILIKHGKPELIQTEISINHFYKIAELAKKKEVLVRL